MRRHSRQLVLLSCLGLLGATAFTTIASAAVVEGTEATFTWAPASGPVAGYNVFVFRNGQPPSSPEQVVGQATATVSGDIDDQLAIQVAAFDAAGSQGPVSALSESALLAAPAPPPYVVVESVGDFGIQAALALAAPGEQVVAHFRGTEKQLLDTAPDPASPVPDDEWGLDQIVVGEPAQPARVRLVDAVGLDSTTPLIDLPTVNLFGLGAGEPCARESAGLVIHAGSRLVLGGVDLHAFDGDRCVHVNGLFESSADPNVVPWGEGEIQLHGDLEDDGVLDPEDNCLLAANFDQCDGDRDGFGSACDADVNNDGGVGLDDLSQIEAAMRSISTDPVLDLNCDGAVGMDDVGIAARAQDEIPGPSGLPCAADASCTAM